MMELRPYQADAVDSVFREWDGVRSTLVVHPTGCGKTVAMAAIAKRLSDAGKRVLLLAHRGELLKQAKAKMESFGGLSCEIEMADSRVSRMWMPHVVAASVQSMSQTGRLRSFDPSAFDAVFVDEAHHATAASYRKVLDHFGGAKVLGVTATPDRGDKVGLRTVFDSVAHVYEIRDAIAEKYLVPIRQKSIWVDHLDLASVRTTAGDLNQGDLEEQLLKDQVLHEVAAPLADIAKDRPTILFAVSVAQAKALADVLEGYIGAGRALAVDGSADEETRTNAIAAFARGDVQVLVNCALYTEGFDAPHTQCVAIARPTKSRALYAQMAGRGTRLSPETGKTDCLLLDFVGQAGRHKLISGLDVLDGAELDDRVRARAQKLADEGAPVHEAIDEAARQVAEEERREKLKAQARYHAQDVDPFELLAAPNRPGRWGGAPVTEKQLALLRRHGIDLEDLDRGQASSLIDKIVARRVAGLCTTKQARLLARYGLNPDVSFEDARTAIDAIAGARWKVPGWLFEDPRFSLTEKEAA